MNILALSLAALTFAATQVHAAGQTTPIALDSVDVSGSPRLVIDCHAELLPSLRAVGSVLESNNASYIYAEREKLAHIAHRECMRGVANVTFVSDTDAAAPALAMAGSPGR